MLLYTHKFNFVIYVLTYTILFNIDNFNVKNEFYTQMKKYYLDKSGRSHIIQVKLSSQFKELLILN